MCLNGAQIVPRLGTYIAVVLSSAINITRHTSHGSVIRRRPSPSLTHAHGVTPSNSQQVLSPTTVVCTTVPLHNAAGSTVSVSSSDGVNFSTPAPGPRFIPAFDWAIGRRPYVYERHGQIVYIPAASMNGMTVRVDGKLVPHRNGNMSSGALPPSPPTKQIPLFSTFIVLSGGGELNFSFATVPTLCYMNLELTLTLPDGRVTTSWKLFHRAPPPGVSVCEVCSTGRVCS